MSNVNLQRLSLQAGSLNQTHPTNQANFDSDLTKSLDLVINIKENIHTILENVGKTNFCQNESTTNNNETTLNYENSEELDTSQKLFYQETDTKYLQEKATELNLKLSTLEGILNSLQPIQINSNNEFISLLVDQFDEKSTLYASKTMFNYRWLQSLQEKTSNPMIAMNINHKRYQNSYNDRKSWKYKPFKSINNTPTTMQDFERGLQQFMSSNSAQVKLGIKYINEKESIIEIVMPNPFRFILYLFEYNIERIQVKPNDMKIENVTLFEKLEENCTFAYTYYKSFYDSPMSSLKSLLQWIKSFVKLFNEKCIKCEKHLSNGLPPLWRDLKSFENYHDECRS